MTENVTPEAATMEQTMAEVYDKFNQPRDDVGKFSSSDPVSAEMETVPEAQEDQQIDTQGANEQETAEQSPENAAQQTLKPPASWTNKAKEEWSKIPSNLQEEILRREKDVARGFEEKGREANFAKSIRQIIEPYKGRIQQFGASESDAIDYLFRMEEFSSRDPEGYIIHAAQGLGVNLLALAQKAQQQPQQGYNPQVAALERKLATFEQSVKVREQASAQEEVAKFSADKPYFEDAKMEMAKLLDMGVVTSLEEAYEKAIWADPNIRERILQDQRKTEEDRRRKEAEQKAVAAKKAASINVKSSKGSSPVKPASMEQTMAAVYDRMMAS